MKSCTMSALQVFFVGVSAKQDERFAVTQTAEDDLQMTA